MHCQHEAANGSMSSKLNQIDCFHFSRSFQLAQTIERTGLKVPNVESNHIQINYSFILMSQHEKTQGLIRFADPSQPQGTNPGYEIPTVLVPGLKLVKMCPVGGRTNIF